VSEAKRKIVITIFRDPFDRIFSAFLLSKGSVAGSEPDEKLRARFVSFLDAYATYEANWSQDNVEEYFEVPPVPSTLDQGFSVYERTDLTYILVNLSYLDNFLRQFLFSMVNEEDIGRRAVSLELAYGPHRRNSTDDRNLSGLRNRLLGLVSREEGNERLGRRQT